MIENETRKSPKKSSGFSKKTIEKKFSKCDVLKTNVIPGKSKFGRYQFRECKNANSRITTRLRTYNSGNVRYRGQIGLKMIFDDPSFG